MRKGKFEIARALICPWIIRNSGNLTDERPDTREQPNPAESELATRSGEPMQEKGERQIESSDQSTKQNYRFT